MKAGKSVTVQKETAIYGKSRNDIEKGIYSLKCAIFPNRGKILNIKWRNLSSPAKAHAAVQYEVTLQRSEAARFDPEAALKALELEH